MTTISTWADRWEDGEISLVVKVADRDLDTKAVGPPTMTWKRRVVSPHEGLDLAEMLSVLGLVMARIGQEMAAGLVPATWAAVPLPQVEQLLLFEVPGPPSATAKPTKIK